MLDFDLELSPFFQVELLADLLRDDDLAPGGDMSFHCTLRKSYYQSKINQMTAESQYPSMKEWCDKPAGLIVEVPRRLLQPVFG